MNVRLREIREARGLSRRQMVERLGIEASRYRKWELNSSLIPLDWACRCADILHCSLDELAGRVPWEMSPVESRLLALFDSCDARGRESVLATAQMQSDASCRQSKPAAGMSA